MVKPKAIQVSQKELQAEFAYRDGSLYRLKSKYRPDLIGTQAGYVEPAGYRAIMVGGQIYKEHRLIWLYHKGTSPENEIDHINGDRLDNRIENLRDVTSLENARNQRLSKANKSGFVGVCFDKNCKKWNASIMVHKRQISLGRFHRKKDAVAARSAAEKKYGFHSNHGNVSLTRKAS